MNNYQLHDLIVMNGGVDGVVFIAPCWIRQSCLGIHYTIKSDPSFMMPCMIDEKKYQIKDNYKITLVPLDKNFSYEHYYMDDLLSMIKRGTVIMLKRIKVD